MDSDAFEGLVVLCLFLVFVAFGMWFWELAIRAVKFRRDLAPGGRHTDGTSFFWVVNVLRPSNYGPDGRRAYRRLLTVWIICQAAMLAAVITIVSL